MSKTEYVTLDIANPKMEFSAGHFTIFSATEREPMHGHNYTLQASITAALDENGVIFDYCIFKDKLISLCRTLNNYFILPLHSPYLKIEEYNDFYHAHFDDEIIPFLKKDVKLLTIRNSTLEELSRWFVNQLTDDEIFAQYPIQILTIKVFNGTGQSASFSWNRKNT